MFLRGSAILRSPEPDPAGGGGGGGGNDNLPANPFSDEQQTALGQMVNQAITSHMKRGLAPAIAEAMKATNWGEILAPEITKLIPKVEPGDDDPAKPKPKGGGQSDLERQIAKLAAELETEKLGRTEAEKRRMQAEQDRRQDAAKIKLRTALQDKVAPGALEHAVAYLTVVENRLKVDENGNATFRVRRAPYKGAPEEDVDVSLEEAIPVVLGEETMKVYLPPPKGSGGNNPGPKGNGAIPQYTTPASTEDEKSRRVLEKTAALLARHNLPG